MRRSPTPGPRGLRVLPRSNGIPSGTMQRPVKRSASMGLRVDMVSHAVKWREREGASPVRRSPLKRALSADDSPLKSKGVGLSKPGSLHVSLGELSQSALDKASGAENTEALEAGIQGYVSETSIEDRSSSSQQSALSPAVDSVNNIIPDDMDRTESRGTQASISTIEEPNFQPPSKPWTKLNRILGTTDLPENATPQQRSSSRLGFDVKKSTDSLNSLFRRQRRGSPDKYRVGSRANSRASSRGIEPSETGNGGGAQRTDSKGRLMRFWRKA